MKSLFPLLVVIALIATIGVLATGVAAMGRGGAWNQKHEGELMSARVALQALAVVLVLAAMAVALF